MDVSENFTQITALICEPSRAKILWYLLDGSGYTASELAAFANLSITSASNHLSKLLEAGLLKVEHQGRYRYYSFSNAEVAYVIEALAQLAQLKNKRKTIQSVSTGMKRCRTCYDHLAGTVSIQLVEAMQKKNYLKMEDKQYSVTKKGWDWLLQFNIKQSEYENIRRPLTRQCLDWSERRSHLAGQLGADLLKAMLQRKWFRKVQFSREMIVTAKGRKEIGDLFGVTVS
ncbi:helix-turn-helix transcriptional regulator [Olivibacter ginsenosidimutans]|uniref:Helix-turn-helix transcriptional regulator n=1 Tax=Olivibacter ginsenosidimutans TaxID=1176537 RepID=A0ABP9AYI7_9SPHI